MKKLLSILISMILIFNISLPALAQESSNIEMTDFSNHWAEEVISKWVKNKLMTGYPDGTFKPDGNITKAEFLTIVNRTYGFNAIASENYSDVLEKDWYYDATLIAKENKYMDWYQENKLKPNEKVTRQEVCAIIASIDSLKGTEDLMGIQGYKDKDSIPEWSIQYIDAVVNKGYIKGYENNTLRAAGQITRAEAIVVLDRVVGELINKEGTYGPEIGTKTVDANLTINTKKVVLQNTIIKGDLVLAAGIQEGEVDLNNVVVEGTTIINGGGENSITFNSCELGEIIVLKVNGKIRVVSKDSEIGKAVIKSSGKLEGEFKNTKVQILGQGEKVELEGDFNEIKVESQVQIEVTDDTDIDVIEITKQAKGTKIDIEKQAVVNEIIFNEATEVTGEGKIKKAKVNADGVTTEQDVDVKIVSDGKDGSGVKEKKKSGGSSSGGSSSGGKTRDTTAPTSGNGGVLSYSDVTVSSVTVNWIESTDNRSSQDDLEYLVYYSTEDTIQTVADVVYGTKVGAYTADINLKKVTGLTEDTTYYFNVIVKDEAGNKSAYVSNSVKTAISQDREAPIAGNGGALNLTDVTANSIIVNWTKATDDRSAQADLEYVVYYSESDSIQTVADVVYGTKVGEYTADINMKEVTGLSEDTTYYFNVIVKDEAGNKTVYTSVSDTTDIIADTTAPTITFAPADGTTDVSIYTNITITFNEAVRNIDNSILENSNFAQMITLRENNESGPDVRFSATIDSEKKVVTIVPNPGTFEFLKYKQVYYVSMAGSVEDSENNAISSISETFTTVDGPIAKFSPVDGTTDVAIDSNIIITFSKPVRQENDSPLENGDLAGRITFRETDSSGAVVVFTATIDSDKKTITIDPSVDLKNNQTYYVAIARSVEDYENNLNHASTTTFTTIDSLYGSGTEDDPYQIRYIEDLAKVGTGRDGWNLDKHYILMNDLDFTSDTSYEDANTSDIYDIDEDSDTTETFKNALISTDGGKGWKPIGSNNSGQSFLGAFDGDGYCISNLYIKSSSLEYAGLFGCIGKDISGAKGEVENLGISNASINITNSASIAYVGGLAGKNNGIVYNCYASADIDGSSTNQHGYTGGLIGDNGGEVDRCYASGTVSAIGHFDAYAGGLIGRNYGDVSNSYATAYAVAENAEDCAAGGLIGYMGNGLIDNSYATGNVVTTNNSNFSYAGGLVGYAYKASEYYSITIENCYAIGNVSANANWKPTAGGLVGRNNGGLIKNSIAYNSAITASGYTGRVTAWNQGTIEDNYAKAIMTVNGSTVSDAVSSPENTLNGKGMSLDDIRDVTNNNPYANWEFDSDSNDDLAYWKIEDGTDRPVLYADSDEDGSFEKLGNDNGEIPITYLINDSFEAENVGDDPANWSEHYNKNNKINDDVSVTGEQSLRIEGASGWATVVARSINVTDVKELVYESYVYPTSSFENGTMDIGTGYENRKLRISVIGDYIQYSTSAHDNNDLIPLASYSVNTWYHIKLVIDLVNNNYDVYIDGELKATDITLINMSNPIDTISLASGNDSGSRTIYYDDVKVYRTK